MWRTIQIYVVILFYKEESKSWGSVSQEDSQPRNPTIITIPNHWKPHHRCTDTHFGANIFEFPPKKRQKEKQSQTHEAWSQFFLNKYEQSFCFSQGTGSALTESEEKAHSVNENGLFLTLGSGISSARNENLRQLLNTNIPQISGKYGLRNHFWPLESCFLMRKSELTRFSQNPLNSRFWYLGI